PTPNALIAQARRADQPNTGRASGASCTSAHTAAKTDQYGADSQNLTPSWGTNSPADVARAQSRASPRAARTRVWVAARTGERCGDAATPGRAAGPGWCGCSGPPGASCPAGLADPRAGPNCGAADRRGSC